MKRILIIGGTGMLRGATDYFISNNFHVSVVGRNMQKLSYFTKEHPDLKTIDLINEDYCDTDKFIAAVNRNIEQHGIYDIIISWIHSSATNSLLQLIDLISKYNSNTVFYHIKSSQSLDSAKSYDFNSKLVYREIFLGFKIDNNLSRWLTDSEISEGTIEAVRSNKSKFIVGQIEPKELRP